MEDIFTQGMEFITIDDENRPGEKITLMVPKRSVNTELEQ